MQRVETAVEKSYEGINWSTSITMVVFHILSVVALFFFTWQALAVTIFLWWVSGSLGVGMGYHRLLTHRGFKTPKFVEYFLTLCATLSLESGPINWVATHRIHHQHTEVPGADPHTPREGGWWAHMGWILTGTAQQYSEATLRRYAPDLYKDRVHRLINRFFYIPLTLSGVILYWLGGWSFLLWGVFFRVTFGLHATWLVNSATHMWGTRRFETTDDSRNNWWVALLSFGEGWHNNHHAHPVAARHGLKWYEIDMNWWGIRTLQLLGLAKNIKLINEKGVAVEAKQEAPELSRAA